MAYWKRVIDHQSLVEIGLLTSKGGSASYIYSIDRKGSYKSMLGPYSYVHTKCIKNIEITPTTTAMFTANNSKIICLQPRC
jgi:hypothetical protein